jgi:hypothetical protein
LRRLLLCVHQQFIKDNQKRIKDSSPNSQVPNTYQSTRKFYTRAGGLLNLGGASTWTTVRIAATKTSCVTTMSLFCDGKLEGLRISGVGAGSGLVWCAARRAASLDKRRTVARTRRRETGLTLLTALRLNRSTPWCSFGESGGSGAQGARQAGKKLKTGTKLHVV